MLHFEYNKIRECTGFWSWLDCSWAFINRFGIKEWGLRSFGLSISNFKEGK